MLSAPTFWNSLNYRKKILGVERKIFIAVNMLWWFLIGTFRIWWLLVPCVLTHFILMWITHRNPDIFDIYMKYRRQGDFYRPWISPKGWKNNRRPEGFGRI